jgi:hypothetical protein
MHATHEAALQGEEEDTCTRHVRQHCKVRRRIHARDT